MILARNIMRFLQKHAARWQRGGGMIERHFPRRQFGGKIHFPPGVLLKGIAVEYV
jgi:hypothetical protein